MAVVTGLNTPPVLSDEGASKQHADNNAGGVAVGTVLMYPSTTAPSGYLVCNGQAVSRSAYPQLFITISTTYGAGDGSTTFNVPDLRARFPIGRNAVGNVPTLGGSGGTFNHSHTMADHTHNMNSHTHSMAHEHTIDHTHTFDHSHSMLGHTHSMAHTHVIPAHTHIIDVTSSGAVSSHTIPVRSSTAAGTTSLRGSSGSGTNYSRTTGSSSHSHSLSGSVGPNTSGDADQAIGINGATYTDGPSQTNTDALGTSTATGGASATSTTAQSTATTGGPSVTNTSGMTASASTTTNNPPYLVLNFIIKH